MGCARPARRTGQVRRIIQALSLGLFLYLFLYVAWPYAATFSATVISDKEWVPLESYLWLDPLAGVSTALAARQWNVALFGVAGVLLASLAVPRGFCGYVCPLGILIDGFDWLIGRRFARLRAARPIRWAGVRYYLLAAILSGSACGVLLAGYFAAIPVLTRGLFFTVGRLELGLLRHWGQVAPADAAAYLSVALLAAIFLLGLLGRRFWCRHVCPSGALVSLFSVLRLTERRVKSTCTGCGRCAQACPFGAVGEDFQARPLQCASCRTCQGACPADAIRFTSRWAARDERRAEEPAPRGKVVSRRGLLVSAAGGAVAAAGTRLAFPGGRPEQTPPLRPPGSVPEREFLALCIRCGECFKVCPGPVLHPAGLESGLEALWTPVVVPSHAGCHQDCTFCTQVCPTGAIRPLSVEEKRRTRMGLAVIDVKGCLAHRGERDCRLCYDECEAAGYRAIEMREIRLEVADVPPGVVSEADLEEMGRIRAPFVAADRCVGCGLCEYRCHAAMVRQRGLLPNSAVVIRPAESPADGIFCDTPDGHRQ